jgi:hypothetical protein
MSTSPRNRNSGFFKAVLIILVVILLWHFVGPLVGIALVLTGGAFAFLVGLLGLLALGTILGGVLIGVGTMGFFGFMIVSTILGIALFPLLLPIVLPIIIILVIVRVLSTH